MHEDLINNAIVIVPCFRADSKIITVVASLKNQGFSKVVVVDDCCPDDSTRHINILDFSDITLHIVRTPENRGVGGAFKYGVEFASENFDANSYAFICKIDADDQHRAQDLIVMLRDLDHYDCDFVKGNRYMLNRAPAGQSFIRKFGNIGLTFLNKVSTGYWHVADPVNGQFAFRRSVIGHLISCMEIEDRYLFESSLLTGCSKLNAKIMDAPNVIKYDGENSSLSIGGETFKFARYYLKNIWKRLFAEYFYPNFDIASASIINILVFLPFSLFYSIYHFTISSRTGVPTEPGTLAIITMSFLIGLLSLFFFVSRDTKKLESVVPKYRYLD